MAFPHLSHPGMKARRSLLSGCLAVPGSGLGEGSLDPDPPFSRMLRLFPGRQKFRCPPGWIVAVDKSSDAMWNKPAGASAPARSGREGDAFNVSLNAVGGSQMEKIVRHGSASADRSAAAVLAFVQGFLQRRRQVNDDVLLHLQILKLPQGRRAALAAVIHWESRRYFMAFPLISE